MKPTPVRIVRLDVYVSIPAVEIVQLSAISLRLPTTAIVVRIRNIT